MIELKIAIMTALMVALLMGSRIHASPRKSDN